MADLENNVGINVGIGFQSNFKAIEYINGFGFFGVDLLSSNVLAWSLGCTNYKSASCDADPTYLKPYFNVTSANTMISSFTDLQMSGFNATGENYNATLCFAPNSVYGDVYCGNNM